MVLSFASGTAPLQELLDSFLVTAACSTSESPCDLWGGETGIKYKYFEILLFP